VATVTKTDFQLKILASGEWKKWDNFVRESPQGTFFQSTTYASAFSEAFQREYEILTVLENNEIIAGIVLYPKNRVGIKYATSPYLIPFNGILLKDLSSLHPYFKRVKYQQKVIELLRLELEKRFHYCEIYLASSISDIRNLIWHNWQIRPDYTIHVPLKIENDSPHIIPHNQRRHIRKFEKSSFIFEESSDFKICYDLMSQSYRHHGIKPPIELQVFQEFASTLFNKKLLKTYIISIEKKPAAFMMLIEDKPTVYALFSGKDFIEEQTETELYLHWRLIKLYREQSYEYFDLLGAMSPSISRVKLELGGELIRQDVAQFFKNNFIRLLLQAESFRQMRDRRKL
jgi:hypothetical protein